MSDLNHTAPGVYTQVIDQSFLTAQTSRFSTGLVGVAERGPFDVPVGIRSLKDYQRVFGGAVVGSFLPQAAAMVSSLSDGAIVVRVGRTYDPVSIEEATAGFTGADGTPPVYTLTTPVANLFSVNSFVRVRQTGFPTVTAQVASLVTAGDSTTAITLKNVVGGFPIYTAASIDQCGAANAANAAEGFASAYIYSAPIVPVASGTANAYGFTLSAAPAPGTLLPGDLIRLKQANLVTTREARVLSISPAGPGGAVFVKLVATSTAEQGYQPVPLQDSYTAATVERVSKTAGAYNTFPLVQFFANTAGTWANSNGSTSGLVLKISPGSSPDTKRLTIFQDSAQVEVIDNLDFSNFASPNFAETRINGKSSTIQVTVLTPYYGYGIGSIGVIPVGPGDDIYDVTQEVPSNTLSGWGSGVTVNLVAFTKGANGENALADNFIGVDDPVGDGGTGLRAFNDTENITVDFLCAPGRTEISVLQEGTAIAAAIRAQFLVDVPDNLNLREATDWHNGAGLYSGQGKLNNYAASIFWNWFSLVDPFDGIEKFVPPTVGALRALAYTFDVWRPWYAAAGQTRGLLPEATGVRYPRASLSDRDASYGNGNSVNPILSLRGQIMVYGERTTQRAESKLTGIHSVTLTNYVMRNLAVIGRQFIFDPNDTVLLSQLYSAYDQFLKGIVNDRGMEAYALNVDASAAQRNNREVEVDLAFIPTDTVERILVNATVNSSGATLNAISAATGGTIGASGLK